MILFASDLDNTLIFSYKKAIENSICVEVKDDKELSFMTYKAYNTLQDIINKFVFVPITTRSIEQYKRIKLLKNNYPKYALVCNGGVLLVNNEVDSKWHKETLDLISISISELNKGIKLLDNDKNIYLKPRCVDDVFVFAKTSNIEETTNILNNNLDLNKVTIKNILDKIYILPKNLTKGNALDRLKNLLEIDYTICSGDSDFDISMLQKADIAIIPKENDIYSYLKHHKNLLVSSLEGMYFSEEIFSILSKLY